MQYIIKLVDGLPVGNPLQLENAIQSGLVNLPASKNNVLSSDLTDSGYGLFVFNGQDKNDDPLKEYVEIRPHKQNADGAWIQAYELRDKVFENQEAKQEKLDIYVSKLQNEIRDKRNDLLAKTDFTQIADVPFSKSDWGTYRTKLRDITDQETFLSGTVVWPEPPFSLDVD